MTEYDSPWKETLELYFEAFLTLLFPFIAADVDWSRGYEFLDKELQQIAPDAEHGQGEVDKLVKLWLKDGSENWLLLHIEVQAQEEGHFTLRMFIYNCRIVDRYNREVISVAVLGDERATWRPNLYRTERWGCRKEFEFPIAKLLDWLPRVEELAVSPNPVARIVLAHLRALETTRRPDDRKYWKFELVRQLYETGMSADDIRKLFRLIDWMMTLPTELQDRFDKEVDQMMEAKKMPFITSLERKTIEKVAQQERIKAINEYLRVRFSESAEQLIADLQHVDKSLLTLPDIFRCESAEELHHLIARWITDSKAIA